MRCSDVTRELSAPTGALGSAPLAEHLAACPRCASWAEQSRRLDRIWEATRPAPLPDAAWDRIWSNVAATLDQPTTSSRRTPAARRLWLRPAMLGLVLSSAAAILLGFVTLLQTTGRPVSKPAIERSDASLVALAPAAVPTVEFDLEQDQVALISLDKQTVRDLAPSENPNSVDSFFTMLNQLESAAPNEVLASRQ